MGPAVVGVNQTQARRRFQESTRLTLLLPRGFLLRQRLAARLGGERQHEQPQ